MSISSLVGSMTQAKSMQTQAQIGAALAKKSLDVQKMQGAAILKLINDGSINNRRISADPNIGRNLDVYA